MLLSTDKLLSRNEMRSAVVILNWHGASDTMACLASLRAAHGNFTPLVIDNGSADDSAQEIATYLYSHYAIVHDFVPESGTDTSPPEGTSAVLVRQPENLGFAGGCNLGLRLALAWGFEVTIMLNNDTVLEPQALNLIATRVFEDHRWFACLPLLAVHGTRCVWNCGGTVSRLGFRRYHHAGDSIEQAQAQPTLECTFFTGCCFAVRTEDFAARSGFSTRFFFGEEDFELGLWMKGKGLRALCLTQAVVWHKVSGSFAKLNDKAPLRKVFVHYLNRFVHMRCRIGGHVWYIWALLYLPYVILLLRRRYTKDARSVLAFAYHLIRLSSRLEAVNRATFEEVMAGRYV
jgi:GT2 family glycosyltransferase